VPVDPVHRLSRPAPGAGLVAPRQTFVRRCHGGLGSSRACDESANQKTEGQSAFGAVKFSGAAKSKAPPSLPVVPSLCLPVQNCYFAPNTCSSLPWWLGFIRACRESANRNMTGGAVRIQGRDFFRRLPSLPVVPPPFIGKSRSYPCPPQDLLLCAKHLFVAAIVAGVHPGLPRIGKSGRDGGRPRLEPVKCSEAAKAKRRRHHRQARLPPVLRFVIPRQRFVHGSHGVNFAPARRVG
jgi:hypothetical protein